VAIEIPVRLHDLARHEPADGATPRPGAGNERREGRDLYSSTAHSPCWSASARRTRTPTQGDVPLAGAGVAVAQSIGVRLAWFAMKAGLALALYAAALQIVAPATTKEFTAALRTLLGRRKQRRFP